MFFNKKYKLQIEELKSTINMLKEENNSILAKNKELKQNEDAQKQEINKLRNDLYDAEAAAREVAVTSNNSITDEIDGLLKKLVGQDEWVIDNINYINTIGVKVKEIVKSAEDTINNMTQTTKDNSGIVNDFTKSFEELLNRVKSIENVSSQINGIASQTQLLSLNASIESARAGEAGRGFTVVAEEIKKLSENTSALLKDIQSTVKETYNIALKAKEQVVSLNHGKSDSVSVAKEAKQGFENVVQKIEEMTGKIASIKRAGDDHLNLSQDIISKVNSIS